MQKNFIIIIVTAIVNLLGFILKLANLKCLCHQIILRGGIKGIVQFGRVKTDKFTEQLQFLCVGAGGRTYREEEDDYDYQDGTGNGGIYERC
ncbi:MAG: hypothetical protein EZS28_018807 [Streblomastix strix]|uniref:Uncharacterized protein n=1 Tax=Streblomastix strix TaxID=222440 RepID=A0A5J4VU24_9EUKA|nr:MAG: hypothetical protein EZS28_018807 [Streblomastix strix]